MELKGFIVENGQTFAEFEKVEVSIEKKPVTIEQLNDEVANLKIEANGYSQEQLKLTGKIQEIETKIAIISEFLEEESEEPQEVTEE